MTYELALSYLASLNESRIKPGLDRIVQALSVLGSPQLKYPHILVGGTNGKGSVVSFLGSALTHAGYRTGLYTSPHLLRFEERITIDGLPIEEGEMAELVVAVKDTGIEMTYFEFATAMGLLYFARRKVDIGILEVGLGGKWDATNAAEPALSILTSVDLDHKEWLGSSLEEVAREKSGIMRRGKPVVVGRVGKPARMVILNSAAKVGAKALLYNRDYRVQRSAGGKSLQYKGVRWDIQELSPGLKGVFQLDNAACALAALEQLAVSGWNISQEDAALGIRSARWPGRYQLIEGSPLIIIDSAHNEAAAKALTRSLNHREKIIWVFSALSGKDAGAMATEMSRLGGCFVIVPLDHPRGLTTEELRKVLPHGVQVIEARNVREGLSEARVMAGINGCVVVAGSVVLAGEALRVLRKSTRNHGLRTGD